MAPTRMITSARRKLENRAVSALAKSSSWRRSLRKWRGERRVVPRRLRLCGPGVAGETGEGAATSPWAALGGVSGAGGSGEKCSPPSGIKNSLILLDGHFGDVNLRHEGAAQCVVKRGHQLGANDVA